MASIVIKKKKEMASFYIDREKNDKEKSQKLYSFRVTLTFRVKYTVD